MRLLHTKNLTLEGFIGERTPQYAILSHTWGEEEVTLQDMKTDKAKGLKGYAKIENACAVAMAGGFEYVWIDTCCIDKTSSAELSEALNSMYRWYEEAEECYAYLADTLPATVSHVSSTKSNGFRRSKWFTRGWTLQELIAPSTVIFLDMNWKEIGSKASLQELISEITGIPGGFLLGDDLGYASVAQRMSWASKRETTRVEDKAYCLLGIFGIFMPMLYGEGERAFIRLQEEIIRISDDHSLFAWKAAGEDHDGILASSPSAFAGCNNIIQMKPSTSVNNPPTITSRGIRLSLCFKYNKEKRSGLAVLNCTKAGKESMRIAVSLTDIFLTAEDFERERGSTPTLVHLKDINSPHYTLKDLYVKQWRSRRNRKWEDVEKCVIKLEGAGEEDAPSYISYLHTDWELQDGMMITTMALPQNGILGLLLILCKDGNSFHILLKKYGKLFSADIYTNLSAESQPYQSPEFPKQQQHERDLIVRSLDGGKHMHISIKMRVLMLRRKKYLVGMMELSYSNALPEMWIEHLTLLGGDIKERKPSLYANERGNKATLQLLLNKRKVAINAKDKDGLTPLLWAVRNDNELVVRLLLQNDAKLEIEDNNGQTPLLWAVRNENGLLIKLLLQNGAKLEMEDHKGQTPLLWAARQSSMLVKLLLENDPNWGKESKSGGTLLWCAFQNGEDSAVKLLLDNTDSLDKEDIHDLMLLLWIVPTWGNLLVKLIEYSAKLEKGAKNGSTPLWYALLNGEKSITKILLDNSANLDNEGMDRLMLLSWAVKGRSRKGTKLLLKYGIRLER